MKLAQKIGTDEDTANMVKLFAFQKNVKEVYSSAPPPLYGKCEHFSCPSLPGNMCQVLFLYSFTFAQNLTCPVLFSADKARKRLHELSLSLRVVQVGMRIVFHFVGYGRFVPIIVDFVVQ